MTENITVSREMLRQVLKFCEAWPDYGGKDLAEALRTALAEETASNPVMGKERSAEYWASIYPVPFGYRLVKKGSLESDNPDFITIPVEYQYSYPDGNWYCSNGEKINGMLPTRARSLYALRNESWTS